MKNGKKKHPLLKKIKIALKNKYLVVFEDYNVLSVQLDAESAVVGFILWDEGHPDGVIISMALDFPDPFLTADICISAGNVSKCYLGEGFYVSRDERILWGQPAKECMDAERMLGSGEFMSEMEPGNKLLN